MYEQRASQPLKRPRRRKTWWPEETPQPEGSHEPGEYYVVIEDVDELLTMLEVASWPHLDGKGRLSFEPLVAESGLDSDAPVVIVKTADLATLLNDHRSQHQQLERPLRIGDVFWVKAQRITDMGSWSNVIDVSRGARERAQMAQAAATFGTIKPARADKLSMTAPSATAEQQVAQLPLESGGPTTAGPAV
jgi:hypothetical protein